MDLDPGVGVVVPNEEAVPPADASIDLREVLARGRALLPQVKRFLNTPAFLDTHFPVQNAPTSPVLGAGLVRRYRSGNSYSDSTGVMGAVYALIS